MTAVLANGMLILQESRTPQSQVQNIGTVESCSTQMAMEIIFTIQHQPITTMECSNLQHQVIIDIFQMTSGAHLQTMVLLQIGICSSRDIQRITLNSRERIYTLKQGRQQTSSILNSQLLTI
jgi:hypothetical protein